VCVCVCVCVCEKERESERERNDDEMMMMNCNVIEKALSQHRNSLSTSSFLHPLALEKV